MATLWDKDEELREKVELKVTLSLGKEESENSLGGDPGVMEEETIELRLLTGKSAGKGLSIEEEPESDEEGGKFDWTAEEQKDQIGGAN